MFLVSGIALSTLAMVIKLYDDDIDFDASAMPFCYVEIAFMYPSVTKKHHVNEGIVRYL